MTVRAAARPNRCLANTMKLEISPKYEPITEKEYCCVPAVLQMVQERRGLPSLSQDEIGFQLGLIVPPHLECLFDRVRTGPEPTAGYGTQTSKEEFSIQQYFRRNHLPLSLNKTKISSLDELRALITSAMEADSDVVVCYNSRLLFGDGDIEHVSLIQEFDSESGRILIVDPAIGAPKIRESTLEKLCNTLSAHDVSEHGGLWIVSSQQQEGTK